jgi:hypothetical protein
MKSKRERFPGLKLKSTDRERLEDIKRLGALRELDWRRIRILELLDEGWKLLHVAEAVGTYRREVRRVGWRFIKGGVEAALTDEPRPKPSPILDHADESAIIAMVCSAPPEGRARWSVRLIAEEAKKRGIVRKVERETVRQLLGRHDLKPWREKNVVRPEARRRVHQEDGGRLEHAGAAAEPEGAGGGAG